MVFEKKNSVEMDSADLYMKNECQNLCLIKGEWTVKGRSGSA